MIVTSQNVSVSVEVTNVLRIDTSVLDANLHTAIFSALTIPNLEYEKAKERDLWGWQNLPEYLKLWTTDGNYAYLPRGFALRLKQILRKYNYKVRWIDRTRWIKGQPLGGEQFSYRDHQPEAVEAIKRHRQGIYKAPTGSGKTGAICGLIWELSPQRTLILVDKINLITQWAGEIDQHIGISVGRIGDQKWSEQRVTIATVQTLWARRYDINEYWWETWDLVVLDECHHVTADTVEAIMGAFTARYRLGVSATPGKTGDFKRATAVLGPVFHEDRHDDLREAGILIKPKVKVVFSNFSFLYWGDHMANDKGECDVPYCTSRRPYHKHRNNYQQLLQALVEDEGRNNLIANIARSNVYHTVLICTDRIKQIENLYQALQADGPINLAVLTGKQSNEERDSIINSIMDQGHGIILSTIANEALNIPSIDRIILGFPTRNAKKTEQQVGRGTRATTGKTDCLVYDIADDVGPLLQQLRSRVTGCYQPLELEVTTINKPAKRKGLGRLNAL